ncbi:DUF7344 domain-containing protein [Haloprofundus salilacus]|uniref:DUF7344 domain-containing protein n=1 Tax=Haloprofundus salilacus TaxID=2876190 RepID=UPI001CCC511C|nr:hypothetical protein [Haloprofundus salilacus]
MAKTDVRAGHPAEQTSDGSLSRDASFSILANHRRRYVVHHLERADEPVTVRTLAERLAAWEDGCDVEELTYKQRKRVYASLHQTHLPKLDSYGVVEYEQERGVAVLTDRAAALDAYLDVAPRDDAPRDGAANDVPWSQFYLGLASVSLAALAALGLGLPPFTLVPALAYATLIAVALLVLAGVHACHVRRTRSRGAVTPADSDRTPVKTNVCSYAFQASGDERASGDGRR